MIDELLLVERTNPDVVLLMETDAWWHEHLQALRESYPYVVEQVEQGSARNAARKRETDKRGQVNTRTESSDP